MSVAIHSPLSQSQPYAEKLSAHEPEDATPADDTDAPVDDTDAIIAQLAALSPLKYERVRRSEAKKLGARPGILDSLVREARANNVDDEAPFDEVEPWPEPIDPKPLFSEISAVIQRFIVCEPETAHAAALWLTMTWFIEVVQVAPLAVITAPEKRCGKSQLLSLLGRMVNRPLSASNITPAALFRTIDAWAPTLLIDEADAFMRDNEELRGLLNCGHTRDSAYTIRLVGDDHQPKQFSVWGAKAVAGIGHLADTIMDRAIILELRRKLPEEQVDRLRHAEPGLFDVIRSKLARFAADYSGAVRLSRPDLPSELNDRAQDNWEPLLAIAECAGAEWTKLATEAALKLSAAGDQTPSTGNELLADIQEVFESKGDKGRISLADLLAALLDDEEKPWTTFNRGKPLAARQLSRLLASYGIKSKTMRFGFETAKGFEASQFVEAFARYLSAPSEFQSQSNSSCKPNKDAAFDVTEGVTSDCSAGNTNRNVTRPSVTSNASVTRKPAPILNCYDVTVENGRGEMESSIPAPLHMRI